MTLLWNKCSLTCRFSTQFSRELQIFDKSYGMFKESSGMESFPQSSFQPREVEDEGSQVHWLNKPQRHIPTDTCTIGNTQNGILDE